MEEILVEMRELERKDLQVALQYVMRQIDHPILPVSA